MTFLEISCLDHCVQKLENLSRLFSFSVIFTLFTQTWKIHKPYASHIVIPCGPCSMQFMVLWRIWRFLWLIPADTPYIRTDCYSYILFCTTFMSMSYSRDRKGKFKSIFGYLWRIYSEMTEKSSFNKNFECNEGNLLKMKCCVSYSLSLIFFFFFFFFFFGRIYYHLVSMLYIYISLRYISDIDLNSKRYYL